MNIIKNIFSVNRFFNIERNTAPIQYDLFLNFCKQLSQSNEITVDVYEQQKDEVLNKRIIIVSLRQSGVYNYNNLTDTQKTIYDNFVNAYKT